MQATAKALRQQAWALKDRCYAAWNTEPAQAQSAAADLQALADQALREQGAAAIAPGGLDGSLDALLAELQALAAWTDGIAQVTQGRLAEAVAAFDHAALAFTAAHLPDPAAQTQVPKIMALSLLGRHPEAVACALATGRALRQHGNLAAAGRVNLNLGNLLLRRGEFAEALQPLQAAALLFARLRQHAPLVTASISLGDTLAGLGQFDRAQRLYQRASRRAARQGLELPQALLDESLALLNLARGQYGPALAGFEAARRRYQALGMPQYLAIAEKQLGDAYLELRLLPEARALFAAAVAQFAELALPEEQAWALVQQGRAQVWLGEAAAAGDSFAQAGALFDAQLHAVGVATVALARAELLLAQAEAGPGPLATAEALAAQAERGFQQAGQVEAALRAAVLRAQAWQAAGAFSEARGLFQATLATAQAQGQLTVQQRCLTGLGELAWAEGDADAARQALEAAIEGAEDQRRALPGDEVRAAFLGGQLRAYEGRLRLALACESPVAVLEQLERARARALEDRLAAPVHADLRQQRLSWLYRRLQRLQDESGDAATADPLGQELRRTEQALLEDVRRQRLAEAGGGAAGEAAGEAGGGGRPGGGTPAWSVAALQAGLPPDAALVAYGELDGEWFAVVVTPRQVQLLRRLGDGRGVLDAVRAARFQIDALRHGRTVAPEHLPLLQRRTELRLAAVDALLWAPLAPALAGARQVLVVAPGVLAALPFAALPSANGLALATAPSARVAWRGLQRQAQPAQRVLALGEDSALPHAGREARFVAGLFPQGQAFTGAHATLATLQQGAAQADILHLACHAQFRSDNPRFSALHLHDGPLTVDLVEQLPLAPGVVVLSACETGLADTARGDEVMGLVRAFLVAGAARVLATLWPVDDAVTARFMALFYGALVRGAPPAQALLHAREALRPDWPHPHYWAAFTLVGGF